METLGDLPRPTGWELELSGFHTKNGVVLGRLGYKEPIKDIVTVTMVIVAPSGTTC